MEEQNSVNSEILYTKVKWFERNERLVKFLRKRAGANIFVLTIALCSVPVILYSLTDFSKLKPMEILIAFNACVVIAWLIVGNWEAYKSLENRIGTDGHLVYLKDYRGNIWSGKWEDIIFSKNFVLGGGILLPIRDYWLRPIYKNEDLEFILSKGKRVNQFYLDMRYLNGNYADSLVKLRFILQILWITMSIMLSLYVIL